MTAFLSFPKNRRVVAHPPQVSVSPSSLSCQFQTFSWLVSSSFFPFVHSPPSSAKPPSLSLSKQYPNSRHHPPPPPLCASHSSEPSPSITYPQNPLPSGRFLTTSELEVVEFLDNFTYRSDLPSGRLRIRAMRGDELYVASKLLAESFSEGMVWPSGYVNLLSFLVKNYLVERRSVLPHAINLLGFYRDEIPDDGEDDKGEGELAGTVEVSFDKTGANATPPTPIPPKNCPYICNMTVKFPLRRYTSLPCHFRVYFCSVITCLPELRSLGNITGNV